MAQGDAGTATSDPRKYETEVAVFDRMTTERRRILLPFEEYVAVYRKMGLSPWLASQPADAPVLEIGCWDGLHLFNLSRITGRPGVGIDISVFSLAAAATEARRNGLPVTFAAMDALRTGFPDGTFRTIFFFNALHHFFSQGFAEVLAEVRRLLHPQGRLYLGEVSLLYPYNVLAFVGARVIKKFARVDCIERNFTDNEMGLWPGFIRRRARRVGLEVVAGSVGFFSYVTRHAVPPDDKTPRLFRAVARTCALLGYLGPEPWKHDCLHMALERRKE